MLDALQLQKQTFEERLCLFRDIAPVTIPDIFNIYEKLKISGFFTAPASIKHHGNYEGALFDHSYAMTMFLQDFTNRMGLQWDRKESPFIIGMFHDLCKFDQYKAFKSEDEEKPDVPPVTVFNWNDDQLIKGHGDKSAMLASTLMQLTLEEMVCIRYHMGAFCEREQWNDYTKAVGKFPNILWTHMADMMAAQVMGV